jgi:hypothetical protein
VNEESLGKLLQQLQTVRDQCNDFFGTLLANELATGPCKRKQLPTDGDGMSLPRLLCLSSLCSVAENGEAGTSAELDGRCEKKQRCVVGTT